METKLAEWIIESIPEVFSAEQFCVNLSEARGRPIELIGFKPSNGASPTGLWVALPDRDQVLYPLITSGFHATHIILHEIGHIVAGHQNSSSPLQSAFETGMFPDIDPAAMSLMLRANFDDDQEREAEQFAFEIGKLVRRRSNGAPPIIQRATITYGGTE